VYAFLGGGEQIFCCLFSTGEFFMGREVSRGVNLSGVHSNYALGEFGGIPIQNAFYMSYILFSVSILRVGLLRVIVRGKF